MTRPDPKEMREALERPSREGGGKMRFGATPEEAAPPGSADAAVKRAAAGWAGRREREDRQGKEGGDAGETADERSRRRGN